MFLLFSYLLHLILMFHRWFINIIYGAPEHIQFLDFWLFTFQFWFHSWNFVSKDCIVSFTMFQVKDNLPVLVWMEVEYYMVCFETEEYTRFFYIFFLLKLLNLLALHFHFNIIRLLYNRSTSLSVWGNFPTPHWVSDSSCL